MIAGLFGKLKRPDSDLEKKGGAVSGLILINQVSPRCSFTFVPDVEFIITASSVLRP